MELNTHKTGFLANGMKVRVTTDSEDLPKYKIAQQKYDQDVTDLAISRQPRCWLCARPATTWLREIVYDLGEHGPPSYKTALTVNSSHYPGPVPGFCFAHLSTAPSQLAEQVYNDHEIVYWGFRPTRWFVMFTDGSMAHGKAVELNFPHHFKKPITTDVHTEGEHGD